MSISVISNVKSLLGESPIWDHRNDCFYFIDIKKPAIFKYYPKSKELTYIDTPSVIGCIVLDRHGGLIAAMKDGLAIVNFEKKSFQFLSKLDEDRKNNRPNDGKCDKAGRLWLATMDDSEKIPSGRLWKISPSLTKEIMEEDFIVGNGIDWSPDLQKMYFTDSAKKVIYIYDFDLFAGTIKNKNIFARIPDGQGFPDGLTVDSSGYLWSAHWDGSMITRYHPSGVIDRIIKLPIPRPTSLTFIGRNLETLLITSASIGLSETSLKRAPLSGSLFTISNPETTGLIGNNFNLIN